MEFVTVLKPGMLTTVQDLGRSEYRIFGVSVSGAMDPLSLRLANILAGNNPGEACLEVTLLGPKLRFGSSGVISVTGGDLTPLINGKSLPMWKAIQVHEGDVLSFGGCKYGTRSYIAFAGGIQVPDVMGSKSTYIRGNYGGIAGRQLQSGDQIPIGKSRFTYANLHGRKIRPQDIPDFKSERPIRFILGPHDQAFTKESLKAFMDTSYRITNEADRMGFRLEGSKLEHVNGADIISDFITVGTIQVPGSGQPIVHMADCGTSGGYTKLGVVIGVDIPYMAQRKPGDFVQFQAINIKEAHEEWKKREKLISQLSLGIRLMPIS